MYCKQQSLVNVAGCSATVTVLKCKCWSCDECCTANRERLRRLALAGHPNKFLTLTVNPRCGLDTSERARALVWAWRCLVKRMARKLGVKNIQYLWVMESTKNGEPHMHVLFRAEYIEQNFISSAMKDLINAPIVWIRRVSSQGKMAAYVSKYCSKDLAGFHGCKRYGYTKDWVDDEEYRKERENFHTAGWRVHKSNIHVIERECLLAGGLVTKLERGKIHIDGLPNEYRYSIVGAGIMGWLSGGTPLQPDAMREVGFEPGWADDRLPVSMTRRGYSKPLMRIERLIPSKQYKRFRPPKHWTRERRLGEVHVETQEPVRFWEDVR